MSSGPEISVVMPVFNAAKTVMRAVRSVLDQTFRHLELIVVDDGSTDGTFEQIQQISDARLKLVRIEHGGVSVASNHATQLAQGALIARMDADDFAYPTKLQRQFEWLQHEQLDVVGCQVRILNENGQPAEFMQRYQRWINSETLTSARISALRFVELPLVNPTILARREYFDLHYTNLDLPEDYDLMLTAAAQGMRFGKVPDILFDWTDGPRRLTRNDPRYATNAFAACRRKHLLSGPLRSMPEIDLWGIGHTGRAWLNWLQQQNISVRRIIEISKRRIGTKVCGVPVIDLMDLPHADGISMLIAVGTDGARALIEAHLNDRGFMPGKDAWFVA